MNVHRIRPAPYSPPTIWRVLFCLKRFFKLFTSSPNVSISVFNDSCSSRIPCRVNVIFIF
jgi:hypothetical protein